MQQTEGHSGSGATKDRQATSASTEVADGGAEAGGDGLGFDEEKLGFCERGFLRDLIFWGEKRCVWVLGVGDYSLDDGDRCWAFDHRECGYDCAVSVLDLSQKMLDWGYVFGAASRKRTPAMTKK